ncbi:TPA: phage tail protein [Salmonella enterica]|uniref:phage minor tail U family protein n=1 Tax=Salmonella enterica TaxID=28901 RepID=UPI00291406BC|nr:phage tail protein [Salmonella enterica]HEB0795939.1 phage tail protein [Salmonella enterica]HEB0806447.1 phage tail protein [Salmonella enterica]HEB0810746.1 phage tail protein [Salmonella enterica]HEB0815321.1 phage tail protein [Salmonella enterica]
MKHTDIREAVMSALEAGGIDDVLFDGRPAVFEEDDFPAVAVYLTNAACTGEDLDADTWQAILHIEVFLPAQASDSDLDKWMEGKIYPTLNNIPGLEALITTMTAQGYDYHRDEEMAVWSSADMTYLITYEM